MRPGRGQQQVVAQLRLEERQQGPHDRLRRRVAVLGIQRHQALR